MVSQVAGKKRTQPILSVIRYAQTAKKSTIAQISLFKFPFVYSFPSNRFPSFTI